MTYFVASGNRLLQQGKHVVLMQWGIGSSVFSRIYKLSDYHTERGYFDQICFDSDAIELPCVILGLLMHYVACVEYQWL